jgi:hypothetical protein
MRGYTLLAPQVYTIVYALTSLTLLIAILGTGLGLWNFGSIPWYPALLFFVLFVVLEVESAYTRYSA